MRRELLMYHASATYQAILNQLRRYPDMEIQDLLKFLHQSTFGCGHMIESPAAAANYLRQEMQECPPLLYSPIEELDGDFCRVHVDYLRNLKISPDTFANLFAVSAALPCGTYADLEEKLDVAEKMAEAGEIPFPACAFSDAINVWRNAGYPAQHHSERFHQEYFPAYRVLANQHIAWLPLLAQIDRLLEEKARVIFAIEGGSAAGKTTVAALLRKLYDCNVFHMDDFFLRPEQRTEERYAQVGGNVDHERFREEVLLPLSQRQTVQYRRFDCATFTIAPAEEILPKKLNIIEGAYSMHPELAGFYDYSVYMWINSDLQRARIEKRNTPEMAQCFFDTWIPMEQEYFTKTDAAVRCDMIWEVWE